MHTVFAFISGSSSCDGLHLDSFPPDDICRYELTLTDSIKFSVYKDI